MDGILQTKDGEFRKLAITSGFNKLEDSAPHGTNHAAFTICRGLAEHGRFGQIDIFLEQIQHLPLRGLPGLESVNWGHTVHKTCSMDDLAHCAGQYVGIYATAVAWLYGQPFALRPVHDDAPVVCEIDCSHHWYVWQLLFAAAISGKIRPSDGLIFKSKATLRAYRRVWEHWREEFGVRREFPRFIMSPQAIAHEVNQHDARLRVETRSKLGIKPGEVVFLTFSRIEPHTKGDGAALILQWADIAKTSVQAVLLIAGKLSGQDHTYLEMLRKLARECGLSDRIIILPDPYTFIPKARTALMSCADVFLHLSTGLEESAPLVVLEAMAHGLPAVAANWSGMAEEVQDGETGFLIPLLGTEAPDSIQMSFEGRDSISGNVAGSQLRVVSPPILKERVSRLASDENLRRSLGEAAARYVRADRHIEGAVGQRVEFLLSLSKEANVTAHAAAPRSDFVRLDYIGSSLSTDGTLSRNTRLSAADRSSKPPLSDWIGGRRQCIAEKILELISSESKTLEGILVDIFSEISEEEATLDWDDDASREIRYAVLRLIAGGYVVVYDSSGSCQRS